MEPDVQKVNKLIKSFEDKIDDIDINIGEYVTKLDKKINITNTNKTVDMSIELENGNNLNGSFTIEKSKVGKQVGNYTMYAIYVMLKAIKSIDSKINKESDTKNTGKSNTENKKSDKKDESSGDKWSPQELKKKKQCIKDIKRFKKENNKKEMFNKFKEFINKNDLDISKISELNPNQMEEFRDHLYS
ncbi:MAG: hypothetical protein ACOCRK_06370 [bacterium]